MDERIRRMGREKMFKRFMLFIYFSFVRIVYVKPKTVELVISLNFHCVT
jgi:hypothetical protein